MAGGCSIGQVLENSSSIKAGLDSGKPEKRLQMYRHIKQLMRKEFLPSGLKGFPGGRSPKD